MEKRCLKVDTSLHARRAIMYIDGVEVTSFAKMLEQA